MDLLNLICNDLKHPTNRSNAIKPEIKLLISLRYYATGAFQVNCNAIIKIFRPRF